MDVNHRTPVADWQTDFDHYDAGYVADPHPILDELRGQCPVARSERYGGLAVPVTYAGVAEAAHDTERFTSRRIIISEVPTDHRGVILLPINLDPPDHTHARRAMMPLFTPKAVTAWEPAIRSICNQRLDDLAGRTTCDLSHDYARHVPADLTAAMLGVEASESEFFRNWVHELMEVGPTDPDVERRATATMFEYLGDLVPARRRNPGDDFISYLLEQSIDGVPVTDAEVAKMMFLLLVAGVDTTWSAMGSAFLHLATHPEDRRRLVAEPDLLPTAIEEFLRAYAPVAVGRISTSDTELEGCPVRAGDWVMLNFPAASRDPEIFDRPGDVIIDRARNRHAAFGLGVHRCIGSNLARVEMRIAIGMLLERFPEFTLADGAEPSYSSGAVRGPRAVPVVLG